VIVAKVPESHRMVYDTLLSGMHARVGLTPAQVEAENK